MKFKLFVRTVILIMFTAFAIKPKEISLFTNSGIKFKREVSQ
jgi:hypothetical protein